MVEIKFCPSTLAEGYNTYSPQAVKRLFDGRDHCHEETDTRQ